MGGVDAALHWITTSRRRKWKWAQKVSAYDDGRWSNQILFWIPAGGRAVGRPKLRWEDRIFDCFEEFFGAPCDWKQLSAVNKEAWQELEELYVN